MDRREESGVQCRRLPDVSAGCGFTSRLLGSKPCACMADVNVRKVEKILNPNLS